MARKPKKRKPVSVAEVLTSKFMKRGMAGLLEEYKILKSWDEIVGQHLAGKTRPGRLVKGLLCVNVESSVISNQLHFLKREVLKKLNDSLGKNAVKDIKFRVRKLDKIG